MEKQEELELWEKSRDRYKQIDKAVTSLLMGLQGDGNLDLEIPECSFCNKYPLESCEGCQWGKKFGYCEDEGSTWLKLHYEMLGVSRDVSKTINLIDEEITKLKSEG